MTKELAGLAMYEGPAPQQTHHLYQLKLEVLGVELSQLLRRVGLTGLESCHGRGMSRSGIGASARMTSQWGGEGRHVP